MAIVVFLGIMLDHDLVDRRVLGIALHSWRDIPMPALDNRLILMFRTGKQNIPGFTELTPIGREVREAKRDMHGIYGSIGLNELRIGSMKKSFLSVELLDCRTPVPEHVFRAVRH